MTFYYGCSSLFIHVVILPYRSYHAFPFVTRLRLRVCGLRTHYVHILVAALVTARCSSYGCCVLFRFCSRDSRLPFVVFTVVWVVWFCLRLLLPVAFWLLQLVLVVAGQLHSSTVRFTHGYAQFHRLPLQFCGCGLLPHGCVRTVTFATHTRTHGYAAVCGYTLVCLRTTHAAVRTRLHNRVWFCHVCSTPHCRTVLPLPTQFLVGYAFSTVTVGYRCGYGYLHTTAFVCTTFTATFYTVTFGCCAHRFAVTPRTATFTITVTVYLYYLCGLVTRWLHTVTGSLLRTRCHTLRGYVIWFCIRHVRRFTCGCLLPFTYARSALVGYTRFTAHRVHRARYLRFCVSRITYAFAVPAAVPTYALRFTLHVRSHAAVAYRLPTLYRTAPFTRFTYIPHTVYACHLPPHFTRFIRSCLYFARVSLVTIYLRFTPLPTGSFAVVLPLPDLLRLRFTHAHTHLHVHRYMRLFARCTTFTVLPLHVCRVCTRYAPTLRFRILQFCGCTFTARTHVRLPRFGSARFCHTVPPLRCHTTQFVRTTVHHVLVDTFTRTHLPVAAFRLLPALLVWLPHWLPLRYRLCLRIPAFYTVGLYRCAVYWLRSSRTLPAGIAYVRLPRLHYVRGCTPPRTPVRRTYWHRAGSRTHTLPFTLRGCVCTVCYPVARAHHTRLRFARSRLPLPRTVGSTCGCHCHWFGWLRVALPRRTVHMPHAAPPVLWFARFVSVATVLYHYFRCCTVVTLVLVTGSQDYNHHTRYRLRSHHTYYHIPTHLHYLPFWLPTPYRFHAHSLRTRFWFARLRSAVVHTVYRALRLRCGLRSARFARTPRTAHGYGYLLVYTRGYCGYTVTVHVTRLRYVYVYGLRFVTRLRVSAVHTAVVRLRWVRLVYCYCRSTLLVYTFRFTVPPGSPYTPHVRRSAHAHLYTGWFYARLLRLRSCVCYWVLGSAWVPPVPSPLPPAVLPAVLYTGWVLPLPSPFTRVHRALLPYRTGLFCTVLVPVGFYALYHYAVARGYHTRLPRLYAVTVAVVIHCVTAVAHTTPHTTYACGLRYAVVVHIAPLRFTTVAVAHTPFTYGCTFAVLITLDWFVHTVPATRSLRLRGYTGWFYVYPFVSSACG